MKHYLRCSLGGRTRLVRWEEIEERKQKTMRQHAFRVAVNESSAIKIEERIEGDSRSFTDQEEEWALLPDDNDEEGSAE
jgi:hypothetical protein